MTQRTRVKGITQPLEVNATLIDSLLTAEQNARIRELADRADALSAQLVDVIATTGKTLEEFLDGNLVEDLARRRLLAPLKQDGLILATLLHRIRTRLRMALPPMTLQQFTAGVGVQLEDASECAKSEQPSAARKSEGEAKRLLSEAYQALASGLPAMETAVAALASRKEWNALLPSEQSALDGLKAVARNSTKAISDITAWRRANAKQDARP